VVISVKAWILARSEPPRVVSRAPDPDLTLLALALAECAGPGFVIDHKLRVVATTPELPRVFGPLDIGVSAARQICGDHEHRPMAEALARGEAMSTHVKRVVAGGHEVAFHIRALPLRDEAGLRGFLLLVQAEPSAAGDSGSEVLERFGVVTREPAMRALLDAVVRVAKTDANVLVRGETGSGKELIAKALHAASDRAKGPFVAINCAALPPQLLESELFGHVRGAFTGAIRDQPGLFQKANGGTLLLDEIAELPIELQPKLLRVIEERSVIPVGGREYTPVDVRFVAATHRSLREAVEAGRFRADLMYRLRVIPLFIPALRERKGDIALITDALVTRQNARGRRQVSTIAEGARERLSAYDFPGNVRELSNAIEYAFAIGSGPVLSEADLPPEVTGQPDVSDASESRSPIRAAVRSDDLGPEARRIARALERAAGHKRRAAESLGMSRTTLWRKMRELGLL